jgi:hypothetical protein
VQELYVTFRGRGVSLSAKDVELVDAWAKQDVPFEVVARGIKKAAEAALWDSADGEGALRNLSQTRAHVKREIDKYLKTSVGRHEPEGAAPASEEPFHLARHRKLLATLKRVERDRADLKLSSWLPRLPAPDSLDAAARQEELAMALVLRSLPFSERREHLREARKLVQKVNVMTASARRESLRFHRAAVLRRALDLPSFW